MTFFPHLEKNIIAIRDLGQKNSADQVLAWLRSIPNLASKVTKNIFENQQGFLDWQLENNTSLFSTCHPQTVYQNWIPQDHAPSSATIVVGASLGYGINMLLDQTPASHRIVVIDPMPEFIYACMSFTNYQEYISSLRLVFLPPLKKSLKNAISQLELQAIYGKLYLRCDAKTKVLDQAYTHWANFAAETIQNFSVDTNTAKHHKNTMMENELSNFKTVLKSGNLKPLYNAGKGIRAVSIGAGPSLTDYASEITKHRANALVIASIQTLPALQALNLKPDLCVGIDYSDIMLKLYDNLDPSWCNDIPLIYVPTLSAKVLQQYPGPPIAFWAPGGIGASLFAENGVVLNPGGTVGLTQIRLLHYFGVQSILLAGMDLGWTGDKTHVNGHLKASDTFDFDPKKHIQLRNQKGETIYTLPAFLSTIREIEADILRLKIDCYNLHKGGADIANAQKVSMDEALRMDLFSSKAYPLRTFKNALGQAITSRSNSPFEINSKPITNHLKSIKKQLKPIQKNPAKHTNHIKLISQNILHVIQKYPAYSAYLYNEMVEIGRLLYFVTAYNHQDLAVLLKTIQTMQKKILSMDAYLI